MEHDAIKLADLLSDCCNTVLVCKKGSFIEQLYNKGDYSFHCKTVSFLNKNYSLSMLLKTRNILDSNQIRNVVYFGASELKTLYFSFIGKDLNVIIRHGTTKSRSKRDLFHRLVYSCVNYHVAISNHLLRNVKKIIPRSGKAKYVTIYPSFSFDQYESSCSDKDNNIKIVHVGRIVPGKGHFDAIQACSVLYGSGIDFELLFLGDGEDARYVEEVKIAASKVPYKNAIRFHGYVDDVGAYLKDADLFLYPSQGEGFGNVFAEAMAHGVSAVTYNNTTFPEFRDIGFKFRQAEDGNTEQLAEMLLEAANRLRIDRLEYGSNRALAADIFDRDREKLDWCAILE